MLEILLIVYRLKILGYVVFVATGIYNIMANIVIQAVANRKHTQLSNIMH